MDRWAVLKDILLTVTGMTMFLSQVFSPHPSEVILTAAVVLTGVPGAHAAAKVLTGERGGSSSRPVPRHGPESSGSRSQGDGEDE